jgi:hypothetical protein
LLLFTVLIPLVPVLNLLYFYISTFRTMCAVPNMAVLCSSLLHIFLVCYSCIISFFIRYGCQLSQAFSSWYFSWTSADPTAQALSFTLQCFPYYVWCSKHNGNSVPLQARGPQRVPRS